MKLQKNKGYVMTDASIAIIILLILVPTIMGIVYSIGVTKRATETKSEAINIVTNAIEAAKGISLSELNEQAILNSIKTDIYTDKMTINEETVDENAIYKGIIKTNKASYQVTTNVVDYKDGKQDDDTIVENVVKTVTATVKYRLSGTDQEISLSTVVK